MNDAIETIRGVLKDALGDDFTSYFVGDPVLIPISLLPAICVVQEKDMIRVSDTARDENVQHIVIKVVLNKLDDYGASDDVQLTDSKLRHWVKGRNPDGTYRTNSIMGVLRRQLTLNNTTINQDVEVDYGLANRTDASNPSPEIIITAEALVYITLTQKIMVGQRT